MTLICETWTTPEGAVYTLKVSVPTPCTIGRQVPAYACYVEVQGVTSTIYGEAPSDTLINALRHAHSQLPEVISFTSGDHAMTETNSLYQLLTLFETARRAGHRIEVIEQPQYRLIGWLDLNTCQAMTISWDMVERISSPKLFDALATHDAKLCLEMLCQGNTALWRSYLALLATPAGRARLFTGFPA
jgi:hypothetical protein